MRLVVVLGIAVVSLTGCASPASEAAGGTSVARSSASVLPSPSVSFPGSTIYVAIRAVHSGTAAAWLKTSPIRLWFEPLNGVRTAIIDAPVNTYNVPTTADAGALWSGQDASGTAEGCAVHCEADGFVGRIVSVPARAAESRGLWTITAGEDSIVFAPTSAPIPERSGCDLNSIDAFPCSRFVSVSATDGNHVLDSLRTTPITVAISGSGKRRALTLRDGPQTITAPVRIDGGSGSTAAGSAKTSQKCSAATTAWSRASFFKSFFAAEVTYKVHASSLLVTSGDRTLQLEAR